MAKISIQPDCGNAPRKLFLKELNVAFANGDMDFVIDNIPDDITWNIVGQKMVIGRGNYVKELSGHKFWRVKELVIDTIITHGPDASVSGQIKTSDNSQFAFCDIYKFKGAGGTTIKALVTFLVKQ